jgi:hypothetical protein
MKGTNQKKPRCAAWKARCKAVRCAIYEKPPDTLP